MRMINDKDLIDKVPELDLVLGGHDHDYEFYLERDQEGNQKGETFFVKSGTDFWEFSVVEILPFSTEHEFHYELPVMIPCPKKNFTVTCEKVLVCHSEIEDEDMK